MADIPLDRMLQTAGVLDEEMNPITDESVKKQLLEIYDQIIEVLRYYVDIKEEYYNLIAVWIIGASMIDKFNTFPYLYLNAMKGSGKTRLLKLITKLTGGEMLNSLTEAVLFRTKGCLGIDEFESIVRKGYENLKELLNSAYKKGTKVKRMKKKKSLFGEEQVVEEFSVYRPLVIANISGMDEVLGDRCISVVLERSNNPIFSKKIERFESKEISAIWCSLCSVVTSLRVYNYIEKGWNSYITNKYTTLTTHTPHIHNTTLYTQEDEKDEYHGFLELFNKIDGSGLNGRMLELSFPLLFIGSFLGDDIFDSLKDLLIQIQEQRNESDVLENYDVALLDFLSQEVEIDYYVSVNDLTKKFKEFLQNNDESVNSKWLGKALKRLELVKDKKRKNRGVEVLINFQKAQDKIKMFK